MKDKDIKLIKLTRDGRFWSMGLVVDTFEQAIERCDKKGKSLNYHLESPAEKMGEWLVTGGVIGPKEYIRQFI